MACQEIAASELPAELADFVALNAEVLHWRLEKFDGDPPRPGEHKQPVEIIEGGKNRPTTVQHFPRESHDNAID